MEGGSKIFDGLSIWVAQRVPMRKHFVDQIRDNGGSIALLEKKADVLIADHARKEQIPGTVSYTFIEQSLREGRLANPNEHRIGPAQATPRIIGSVVQPAKGTRTKYTAAEDRILWDWVNAHPQRGGGTDGNEIYKQLEAKHPQHPWQSWRDRYIKKLKGRPAPSTVLDYGPPTPPLETLNAPPAHKIDQSNQAFTEEEIKDLSDAAEDLCNIAIELREEAWQQFARSASSERAGNRHSVSQWKRLWEETVYPAYQASLAKEGAVSPGREMSKESRDRRSDSSISDQRPDLAARESAMDRLSPLHRENLSVRLPKVPRKPLSDLSELGNRAESQQREVLRSPESPRPGGHQSSLKRKRQHYEKDLFRNADLGSRSGPNPMYGGPRRREIPSTPDISPPKRNAKSPSPLFVSDDENVGIEQERADPARDQDIEDHDFDNEPEPWGQGILDAMARMDGDPNDTQSVFRASIPPLDLDIPDPEGGWASRRDRDVSPEIKVETTIGDSANPKDGDDYVLPDIAEVDTHNYDGDEDEEAEDKHKRAQSTISETQRFFRGPTPMIDFDIPEPDGGFPLFTGTAQGEDDDDDGDDDSAAVEGAARRVVDDNVSSDSDVSAQLEVFIANQDARGCPEHITIKALIATSEDTELAKKVLEQMRQTRSKRRANNGHNNGDENDGWELPHDWPGVWTKADDEAIEAVDGRVIERLIKKHGTQSYDFRRDFLARMEEASNQDETVE